MAGRPRSLAVDAALREAALSTFIDRGYSAFTLDEVARRAGVGRTSLYRRWSTREALLLDALRTWRESYDDESGATGQSLPEMIHQLAEKASQAFGDPFARALLHRLLTLGPEGRTIREGHLAYVGSKQRVALRQAIAGAQRRGTVARDINPDVALDAVAGALVYWLLSGRADASTFDARAHIEDLFRTVGLGSLPR